MLLIDSLQSFHIGGTEKWGLYKRYIYVTLEEWCSYNYTSEDRGEEMEKMLLKKVA